MIYGGCFIGVLLYIVFFFSWLCVSFPIDLLRLFIRFITVNQLKEENEKNT